MASKTTICKERLSFLLSAGQSSTLPAVDQDELGKLVTEYFAASDYEDEDTLDSDDDCETSPVGSVELVPTQEEVDEPLVHVQEAREGAECNMDVDNGVPAMLQRAQTRSCKANGHGRVQIKLADPLCCLRQFTPEEITAFQLSVHGMDKGAKEMYILGVLSSCMRKGPNTECSKWKVQHDRQRVRSTYSLLSRTVCKHAFLFLLGPSICSPETLHTMFTTQEATSFLQDQWGVERVQERFQDDGSRKGLLEEMVTLAQARVPFQSVTLMATPPADRKRPTTDVIKEECKAGIGGLCYNLNVFVWGLLRGVGFTARLCSSTAATPNDHIFVLVLDVERKGEVRLVDCGMGFPTLRSIPLDFEDETPTYVDSFLEYKFVRRDGQYQRMHGDGQKVRSHHPLNEGLDCVEGKWRKIYSFSLSPSDDLSDFDAAFERIFTTPHITPFHHSIRCMAFPEQRALILVNRRLIVEKEEERGELVTTVLDGDEAIVDNYRRYFPSLPEDTVRRALDQWHSVTQH